MLCFDVERHRAWGVSRGGQNLYAVCAEADDVVGSQQSSYWRHFVVVVHSHHILQLFLQVHEVFVLGSYLGLKPEFTRNSIITDDVVEVPMST